MNKILQGDVLEVLKTLPDSLVDCVVTSPPYWGLRDYGVDGQIGLEPTIQEYIDKMVAVFREVRRVLKDEGTLWLNMGDGYAGSWGNYMPTGTGGQREKHTERFDRPAYSNTTFRPPSTRDPSLKPKDLIGQPWRLAFALQADGWYLRSDIIWAKPNPMPESVTDRPTKSHEYVFLLSKQARYFYNADAVREEAATGWNSAVAFCCREGTKNRRMAESNPDLYQTRGVGTQHPDIIQNHRNKRTVWTVAAQPFPGAHFATFPEKLIEPCIRAGCPDGGIVLDPFIGSGTTALAALKLNRQYLGIELNSEYIDIINKRLSEMGLFAQEKPY